MITHDKMIQSEETDHSKARPETSGHHHHHRHNNNNNINNNNNNASKSNIPTTTKPSSSTSTSTASCWSTRFKDPRVVRVSKALGGKDRHSKVCTVRGLRDRRVRLSVPTAIQLYDLQERLGLNQPSKAVDWLLNVAKNEIDELPPLQIPPGMLNFGENYNYNNNNSNNLQPVLDFQDFRSDKQGLKIGSSDFNYRGKSNDRDENSWARNHQEERQLQFHPLENNSNNNNQALLLNSTYNSIFRLDPSNLSLSQHNPRMTTAHQHEDWHNFGLLPFQPALSTTHHHVPSGSSHQVIVYHQPEMSTQPYFPSSGEFDPKQANFQGSPILTVDSTSQPVICRPIHFNMTANLLPSQDNNDDKYR